ncbi:DUF1080 domain-containing protein [Alteromonas sediminis]|uniref:DUF1080 domain-containing protein n=1 Tax=Alteromonas sediminis TaxID=2259342 RepID=A0A3N5YEG3_9ALTE|nr:family 16 glycoside hydrolase [Alteromonas sediminis]RPJ68125.1 DUF1080 domain-containing protein [Alteromonas sediminis]
MTRDNMFRYLQALILLMLCLMQQYIYAEELFDSSEWTFSELGAEVLESENQSWVKMTSGQISSVFDQFLNGTIEFEFKHEGKRAFAFVYFRQGNGKSETVYFRTHKSNAPDAVQYSPEFQDRSAWQIYHGDKGTTAQSLPENTWIKVKLRIINNRLDMWINDQKEPAFEGLLLTGDRQPGKISLRGLIPNGSTASYSAIFKNIKVIHKKISNEQIDEKINQHNSRLEKVNLSQISASTKEPMIQIPDAIRNGKWTQVTAQDDGIFEFLRHRAIPQGLRSYSVVAQVFLDSAKPQTCVLHLGYSDAISVLLNEQIIAHSDASFRYANNRQQGVLHDRQLTIFLPIKKGSNTLQMVVSDSFGGWGLKPTLEDCDAEVRLL